MIISYFRLHLVCKRGILCHRLASIRRLDSNNLLREKYVCISKAGKINHTVICQGHPHSCIKCYGYIQIIIQIYVQITSISGSPRFQTQARGYASSNSEKPFFMVKQLSVWSGDLSNFTSQIWLISSRLSSFGAGQEDDGGRCQGGRGGDAAGLDHEQGEWRLRVNKQRSGYCKNLMAFMKWQRKIKTTTKLKIKMKTKSVRKKASFQVEELSVCLFSETEDLLRGSAWDQVLEQYLPATWEALSITIWLKFSAFYRHFYSKSWQLPYLSSLLQSKHITNEKGGEEHKSKGKA